jgi:N-methylhydantoinase A
VPNSAGALSAIGVLTADVVKDQSRTTMLEFAREVEQKVEQKLEQTFKEMERSAAAALRREGFPKERQRQQRSLALRYKGQSFELEIKQTRGDLAASFHRAHRERYGYAQETNVIEVVSARVRSVGVVEKLADGRHASSGSRRRTFAKPARYAMAHVAGQRFSLAVYQRGELPPGARLRAPCIVTEYSSTTLITQDASAVVDEHGNLIIQVT